MSSDVAIRARGVGKCYALFDKPVDRLKQMLVRGRRRYYREHWAVRGADLEIRKGETVGIVGRNGSGKSTLLQMICGTLEPTEGEIEVRGRIAPLLQLGAGFNPEMTGRENVYLNAAVLGITPAQTARRFDQLAAFADIGDMLDRPVKLYSSGMYARLAFAVAIHVEPEILVVDEALAVGDEAFQRKCFARIEAIRQMGATVLFVSHASATILELCNRAVLLDQGEVLRIGEPKIVVRDYQYLAFAPPHEAVRLREAIKTDAPLLPRPAAEAMIHATSYDSSLVSCSTVAWPSRGAEIRNVAIRDEEGELVNLLIRHALYWYVFEVSFYVDAVNVRFSMMIKTVSGLELAAQWSAVPAKGIPHVEAGTTMQVRFPMRPPFAHATYFANAGVMGGIEKGDAVVLHRLVDACMFRMLPVEDDRIGQHVDITGELQPSVTLTEPASAVAARFISSTTV